ncbi:MAG TPA: hypothetical protein VH437_07865 [Terriglobales bacterium]|jgi:hypothetical protein
MNCKCVGRHAYTNLLILTLTLAMPCYLAAQANPTCPPFTPPPDPNLLVNPDFNTVGPCGTHTAWKMGNSTCPSDPTASAAANWTIHSDNFGNLIRTALVTSTLPIGGGARMLRIHSDGSESGVFQTLPIGLTKVVGSAWVYVRKGHVVMQATAGLSGPSSWSTKTKEWELLRVCTDGFVPVDTFLVYNEDPAGSDFDVDRVEVKVNVEP